MDKEDTMYTFTCTMERYAAIETNEILLCVTRGSKGCSGLRQRKTYGFTYMQNLKRKQNKNRLVEAETKGELPEGWGG